MTHNHILFIDDLRLFTHDTNSLGESLNKNKEFFTEVRFSLNGQKSTCSSDYTQVKTLNDLPAVNVKTGYKYPRLFQTRNPLQMANKKKLIELVNKRGARARCRNPSDRNIIFLLNYSTRVIIWKDIGLIELNQTTVKVLKEKESLNRFHKRLYRLHKVSNLSL